MDTLMFIGTASIIVAFITYYLCAIEEISWHWIIAAIALFIIGALCLWRYCVISGDMELIINRENYTREEFNYEIQKIYGNVR